MRVERGSVPPSALIEIEPIRSALAAHEAAVAAVTTAERELARLDSRAVRIEAERADAAALARSIEEDRPSSKAKHLEAWEQQLATARRQVSACRMIAENRWGDVERSFSEHGSALTDSVNAAWEQRRAEYTAAIEAAETAHAQLLQAKGLRVFVDASSDGTYRPGGAFVTVAEIPVPALAVDSGRLPVGSVLEMLKQCGAPPPALPEGLNPDAYRNLPAEQRHVPLAQQGRSRAFSPPEGPATVRVPG